MLNVRNIFCVGRNYQAHAEELGNEVPARPMVFMKPTHAIVPMDGRMIELPADEGQIHYEAELVVHIAKPYQSGCSPDDLIDQMALGIDLTLRGVQDVLKTKGHPWLAAKGFLQSAPITAFRPFPGMRQLDRQDFSLHRNGQVVQQGNVSRMIYDLQVLIDDIGLRFGLGPGDLIFTGTPEGVGAVEEGDHLQLYWGKEHWGEVNVSLSSGPALLLK